MADENTSKKITRLPRGIATWQTVPFETTSFFGKYQKSESQEDYAIFGLHRKDRRQNTLLIGKTGTGKTSLLQILIKQDLANQIPTILISGTNKSYLALIDANATKKEIQIIDPLVSGNTCYNYFSNLDEKDARKMADSLSNILKKQLKNSWNDRIDFLLRNIVLTVANIKNANLNTGYLFLTNKSERENYIRKINNPELKAFWQLEFPDWLNNYTGDVILPLRNKLEKLIHDPYLKETFRTENKIEIEKWLMNKNSIFINLAKNNISEDDAELMFAIISSRIVSTSKIYSEKIFNFDSPKSDIMLYIDDFSYDSTLNLLTLFKEGKDNKLVLTVSLQSNHNSSDEIMSLVNVAKNLIIFKVNIEDAQKLKSELIPVFDTKDLTALDSEDIICRLHIQGKTSEAFLAKVLKNTN